MATPDYVLVEEYVISTGPGDPLRLPRGTFVRPIEKQYVPKHILDDPRYKYFTPETEMFIYCYFGIIVIRKELVRRVDG